MGDFVIDWSESHNCFDEPNHGIPIPRNQQTLSFTRSNLEFNMEINEQDSPCRPPLVPPNSLVSNFSSSINYSMPFELNLDQRATLSPFDAASPIIPGMTDIGLEVEGMEIKMEPLESMIGDMINTQSEARYQEDNLLDNVNFDDLFMTDDMESSTTCLDPQHSSPAAMAAVHPDEVLGITRSEQKVFQQTFTPSINVPVKPENCSLTAVGAFSLPPQGFGWKSSSINQQTMNQNSSPHHNSFKNFTSVENRISGFNQLVQPKLEQNPNSNKLHSFISADQKPTISTLHNLLVNSPSTSTDSPPQGVSPTYLMHPTIVSEMSAYVGQSVPDGSSFLLTGSQSVPSRLCSSAPVSDFSLEQFWLGRDSRSHLLSTGSLAEEVGGSTSSLSTGGGILSPIPHDLSIEEELDSDDDSDVDHDDSDSDDNESIMNEEISIVGSNNGKKERHFWQYNVQAKGPKGQRVNIMQRETNPHRLTKIMDPVFSPLCSVQGIKHSGKARRGDGNDLTPSPRKLVSIGTELDKLNQKIAEMTPVSELHSTVRSRSRKEKNKLASRACRLKKKAQHEANKIKLFGLNTEHQTLLSIIRKLREDLVRKAEMILPASDNVSYTPPLDEMKGQHQLDLTNVIEQAAKLQKDHRIAGNTTEFINRVIENYRSGNLSGSLEELARTFTSARISSPDVQQNQSEMIFS